MIVFPNCKINLGLIITGKRSDGYHDIASIFYPVPLHDALEIIHSTTLPQPPLPVFTHSGIDIDGAETDNLCIKTWHLLKKDFPRLPSVQVHLHKAVPIGAGLGGGSADAAFTLTALNSKYMLNLSDEQLLSYALQLGSDCPFFILNKPCLATGRGELLQPVDLSLSGYRLVLVNPGIHINTKWAFSQLQIAAAGKNVPAPDDLLKKTISVPVSQWKDILKNDFENPVMEKYPEIGVIKDTLYGEGALFASMSGSGSTVYGIFDQCAPTVSDFPQHYFLASMLL
ncbi:MAG: 4-(cytidine 5'-diphospho)-2-C-methyl-D-erythritol kinase [Ferruginibacter sp.]